MSRKRMTKKNAGESLATVESIAVPVTKIRPNPNNPNTEKPEVFSALVTSIREMGMVDPLQVWRLPKPEGSIEFELLGGEHRYRAAQTLGYEDLPVVVVEAVKNREQADAFTVRLNMIRGEMDRKKVAAMARGLRDKYGGEIAQHMLGLANEAALDRLVAQTSKALPADQAAELRRRRNEIRTVEDLTLIVNEIMSKWGDTTALGFIHFRHGGKTHLLVEMTRTLQAKLRTFMRAVVEEEMPMADALDQAIGLWLKDHVAPIGKADE